MIQLLEDLMHSLRDEPFPRDEARARELAELRRLVEALDLDSLYWRRGAEDGDERRPRP